MDRRRVLYLLGAAVSPLAGCSTPDQDRETNTVESSSDSESNRPGNSSEACSKADPDDETRPLIERADVPAAIRPMFDDVKNVSELGADTSGEEPITTLLQDASDDNTLLVFPEGRYRLGRLDLDGVSNLGFVSMKCARPTLVPDETQAETGDWFIALSGENVVLRGFELDFTQPGHGARTQIIATDGDFWCQDIRIIGQIESAADAFGFLAENEGGVGHVERLIARDGSPTDGGSTIGIYVHTRHAGSINIVDCEMWHFQGKGIYASSTAQRLEESGGGEVNVEGGRYKNNNPAHIRSGGGSTIRNVTFRNEDTLRGDSVTWKEPLPTRRGVINARSLRIQGDQNGRAIVENCEFYHEIGSGSGVITVTPTGGAVVRDCDITVADGGLPAIHLKPDNAETLPSVFENISIDGEMSTAPGVLVRERSNVQFEDSTVALPNTDGFSLTSGSSVSVLNTDIDAGQRAFKFDDTASEEIHSIRFDNTTDRTAHSYEVTLEENDELLEGSLPGAGETVHEFPGDIRALDVDAQILVEVSA